MSGYTHICAQCDEPLKGPECSEGCDPDQAWPIDEMRKLLERAGLRVVTEKDAAVLEKSDAIPDGTIRRALSIGEDDWVRLPGSIVAHLQAELARREAFHSGKQSAPESAAAAENTLKTR